MRDTGAGGEATADGAQCIWVRLAQRNAPGPLQNDFLQWVDWKMQGALSRFLTEERYRSGGVTFLATMKRLGVAFIALDCAKATDPQAIAKSCEGLKLETLLLVEEDTSQADGLKKMFSKTKADFPKKVWIATEGKAKSAG